MAQQDFEKLTQELKKCNICEAELLHGVRPVFQIDPSAKILIAGQAPGRKVHETGIPFDDASGERLRSWMGISSDVFYDATKIAILPMGFCYPGTGTSGDLPPRPICADKWRQRILDQMGQIELILVIGTYAMNWHLKGRQKSNLTQTIKSWQDYWPNIMPMPHPSPRNNIWLKKNPWFEAEVLPNLKQRIEGILASCE